MTDEEKATHVRPQIKYKRPRNRPKIERKRPMPVSAVGEKAELEKVEVPKRQVLRRGRKKTTPLPSSVLENRRHEMFAQNLAIGMSNKKAYSSAGYTQGSGNAANLAAKPEVAARVKYIQESLIENRHAVIMHNCSDLSEMSSREAMVELGITKAYLLSHLQNNVVLAQEVGQISASNKAIAMLWSVLNEGNPGDPDASSGPTANKPVSLNILLNFAEKLNEKAPVNIVEDDDIRLVDDEELKDVSE